MKRKCGECSLCCTLLPVAELSTTMDMHKKANERCKFQRFHKGCSIYGKREFPSACRVWDCRWIKSDLPENMGRPDRVGYVVDELLDLVVWKNNDTGEERRLPAVQVWIDPRTVKEETLALSGPLSDYVNKLVDQGFAVIFRNGSRDAMTALAIDGVKVTIKGKVGMQSSVETFSEGATLAKLLEGLP